MGYGAMLCDGYPKLVQLVDDDFPDIFAEVFREVRPARAEAPCHTEGEGVCHIAQVKFVVHKPSHDCRVADGG